MTYLPARLISNSFATRPRICCEMQLGDRRSPCRGSMLSTLLADDPDLAVSRMVNWSDHRAGANPLNYIAMVGFDHERLGLPADLPGTGRVAAALIDAGAPVDGLPGDSETPLMTAASYGDAEVAQLLIDAGANIEARASTDAGGVPGGTALMHAAVFGMTKVLDLLVRAGAQPHSIESAAAVGDITGWLTPDTPLQARIRALSFAADHQRLSVIDQLIEDGHTALDLCQPGRRYLGNPGHDEVVAILRPLTTER